MGQDGMQPPQEKVSGCHWSSSTANHCKNCRWMSGNNLKIVNFYICASMRTHYGEGSTAAIVDFDR
eukprot:10273803-Prorocentrum_lima.AAC.1